MAPQFPNTEFTNKLMPTKVNSLNFSSVTLSYLPQRVTSRFVSKIFMCLRVCVASQHVSQSEMMFDNALIDIAWFTSLDY